MAKKRGRKGNSVMGYFRQLFEDNPQWLKGKSNEAVFARYRQDHNLPPDAAIPKKIKYSLANTKSLLRRKKRRAGRPPAAAGGDRKAARPVNLEALELSIDRSLWLAHNLDPDGLADVIRWLRRARNDVILKSGQ